MGIRIEAGHDEVVEIGMRSGATPCPITPVRLLCRLFRPAAGLHFHGVRSLLLRLASVLLVASLAVPARAAEPSAAPAGPGTLTSAQVQHTLAVLRDDRRRAELIGELEAISQALSAPSAATASASTPATAPAAATPAAATPAAPAPAASPLTDDGLVRRLLAEASTGLRAAVQQLVGAFEAVNDLPDLVLWLKAQASDPQSRARIVDALWRVGGVFAGALAAEWIAIWLLRRPRAALARWSPSPVHPGEDDRGEIGVVTDEGERLVGHERLTGVLRLVRRLPLAVAQLLIGLLPVAVFVAVGVVLLGGASLGASDTARFAAFAALEAYAFCRVVLCFVRLLVAPRYPRLRLVHISDKGARFAVRLTRWVVGVGATGYAVGQVGLALGMYLPARQAWFKLVALVVVLILIGGILHCRRAVALRLRALWGETGALAMLRDRFAEVWHLVAIFSLVAIWLVWAAEVRDGVARLAWFAVSTAAVLVVARLVGILSLGSLEKLLRPDSGVAGAGFVAWAGTYYRVARRLVVGLIAALTVVALLQVWGFSPLAWFESGSLGGQVLSALVSILVTVTLAVVVWEGANAGIERYLARLSHEHDVSHAARLRTLLPFLRTTLLAAILLVAGLTVLSRIGVNVAPLLAGAGVIGIAVGFGGQTLVKDVITGLFLLLENAMQVGDTVTVAGMTGVVEALSIRTIRLRAGDGSIYIIPFSAVATVNNASRDFAFAAVSVGVAYKEDTDRVSEVLHEIVAAMRGEPRFRGQILGDFSPWGVDHLGDFAVTVAGQVKTTPAGRWPVQREINRRIKRRFQALGIEIPFPVQTVLFGEGAPPGESPHADKAQHPPPRASTGARAMDIMAKQSVPKGA